MTDDSTSVVSWSPAPGVRVKDVEANGRDEAQAVEMLGIGLQGAAGADCADDDAAKQQDAASPLVVARSPWEEDGPLMGLGLPVHARARHGAQGRFWGGVLKAAVFIVFAVAAFGVGVRLTAGREEAIAYAHRLDTKVRRQWSLMQEGTEAPTRHEEAINHVMELSKELEPEEREEFATSLMAALEGDRNAAGAEPVQDSDSAVYLSDEERQAKLAALASAAGQHLKEEQAALAAGAVAWKEGDETGAGATDSEAGADSRADAAGATNSAHWSPALEAQVSVYLNSAVVSSLEQLAHLEAIVDAGGKPTADEVKGLDVTMALAQQDRDGPLAAAIAEFARGKAAYLLFR